MTRLEIAALIMTTGELVDPNFALAQADALIAAAGASVKLPLPQGYDVLGRSPSGFIVRYNRGIIGQVANELEAIKLAWKHHIYEIYTPNIDHYPLPEGYSISRQGDKFVVAHFDNKFTFVEHTEGEAVQSVWKHHLYWPKRKGASFVLTVPDDDRVVEVTKLTAEGPRAQEQFSDLKDALRHIWKTSQEIDL